MDSGSDDLPKQAGFPHSEILGLKPVCRLPEAYRRLPRPSSPSTAKASTVCAYSLDHITPISLESWFAGPNATYPSIEIDDDTYFDAFVYNFPIC